jgi:hypothetical protein
VRRGNGENNLKNDKTESDDREFIFGETLPEVPHAARSRRDLNLIDCFCVGCHFREQSEIVF